MIHKQKQTNIEMTNRVTLSSGDPHQHQTDAEPALMLQIRNNWQHVCPPSAVAPSLISKAPSLGSVPILQQHKSAHSAVNPSLATAQVPRSCGRGCWLLKTVPGHWRGLLS